jgi:hypothetical protein
VLLAAVLIAALGLPALPGAAAPPAAPAFTPGTPVDPVLGGADPVLAAAAGRVVVAWRPGDASAAVYRSTDGGASFVKRYGDAADPGQGGPACATAQTPACLTGPGTGVALAVEPRSADVLVAAGSTSASLDGGASVPLSHTDLATAAGEAVGAVATGRARLVARQLPTGVLVARSDDRGAAGSWQAPALAQVPGTGGGLVAARGAVYVPLLDAGRVAVAVSRDGGRTFAVRRLPHAAASPPRLAVDRSGGLALAWASAGRVLLARSAGGAARWTGPVRVATAPGVQAADVVAGDAGRVAVSWYGRSGAAWYPKVALSTDGRTFRGASVAHQPSGSPAALRRAPALAVDGAGHLLVAWTRTAAAPAAPTVVLARQAAGPSLLRGRPAAARPVGGGAGRDAAGDARYPLAGKQLLTAPARPRLDLTGTAVSVRPDGVLELRTGIAETRDLGRAAPGGAQDGRARYVTRFDLAGRTFYAGADVTAGADRPTFFAGELGAAPVPLPTGRRTHSYAVTQAVTGRVESGRLVVHVPGTLVGHPGPGSRLLSLTTSAMLGPLEERVGPLPVVVDSTPAYDARLGPQAVVDGALTPLHPTRLLDSRRTGGALKAGEVRRVRVRGVPAGTTSVLLHVTALGPRSDGEVTAHPGGQAVPVSRGRTSGSLLAAPVAADGTVGLSAPGGHLLVALVGAARDGAGSVLTTTTPRTLLRTRTPLAATPTRLKVAEPGRATAVLLAVSTTASRRAGSVEVWGRGGAPGAAGVRAEPGRQLTETVVSAVAPDGTVGLATSAGATHVRVDLLGTWAPPSAARPGNRLYPVPPVTVVDRASTRPGQVLLVRTAGLPQVPGSARQVLLQVTAYGAKGPGYLTVWRGGRRPDVPSLRLLPGRTTSGLVLVDLPANRAASVYVSGGNPQLRVDVVGATHP